MRYRLVQDDDGHWYLIDARDEQAFEIWVRATQDETLNPIKDFNSDRIAGSPSNITFTDPQED